MNRYILGLILLATTLSFNSVASEEEENDNNGKHLPPSFASVDTNGDGVIDQEELDSYRGKDQADDDPDDPEPVEQNGDEDKTKLSAFASFDKDKDGFITEEELAAHSKYSNPGNGSGERKSDEGASSNSRSDKGNNRGGNKDSKGKNK
ncbi:MAG: hypothetical protein JKY55_05555 [Aliivibrio sp.]|uniref:hypothetical protein n=1 Tax=Aliivibrio sp. TaxID=1872443 RepID=UPI001A50119A|nr:hypothetical protein [Aliivibrio sp.]